MRSPSQLSAPNRPASIPANKRGLNQADIATLAMFDKLPDSAFVREAVVRAYHGNIGRTTLWNYVRKGILPAPEKLGPQTNVWNVGKLRAARAKWGA